MGGVNQSSNKGPPKERTLSPNHTLTSVLCVKHGEVLIEIHTKGNLLGNHRWKSVHLCLTQQLLFVYQQNPLEPNSHQLSLTLDENGEIVFDKDCLQWVQLNQITELNFVNENKKLHFHPDLLEIKTVDDFQTLYLKEKSRTSLAPTVNTNLQWCNFLLKYVDENVYRPKPNPVYTEECQRREREAEQKASEEELRKSREKEEELVRKKKVVDDEDKEMFDRLDPRNKGKEAITCAGCNGTKTISRTTGGSPEHGRRDWLETCPTCKGHGYYLKAPTYIHTSNTD